MVKINFNGGGSARDRARGQTSRSRTQRARRTVSRGSQRGVSGKTTYVTPKATSNKKNIQQNIKTQQDQSKDKPQQHKLLTSLNKLQAQGKDNTEQAKVLKRYLSGVVSPDDRSGDKTPFHQKQTLLDDYHKKLTPTQISQYKSGADKPEAKWITLPDGSKVLSASSFTPGQFSQNQYKDVLDYGVRPTDPSSPWMDFGFGSVFSASSGSTASSPAVQKSLETMMDDLYDKGYTPDAARQIAMDKMYPSLPSMSKEEYLSHEGAKEWEYDYLTKSFGDTANFMSMPTPNEFTKPHQMIMNTWQPKDDGLWSGYGSSGGGWGSGWGSGGGGGDGSGYGFSMQQDPMQQGYQRAQVGPGTLQEQVNQIYLGMSNINPAPKFNRGGIVSLVQ